MYYAMGHFSKFMTEGSVRIGVDTQGYDADRVQVISWIQIGYTDRIQIGYK